MKECGDVVGLRINLNKLLDDLRESTKCNIKESILSDIYDDEEIIDIMKSHCNDRIHEMEEIVLTLFRNNLVNEKQMNDMLSDISRVHELIRKDFDKMY